MAEMGMNNASGQVDQRVLSQIQTLNQNMSELIKAINRVFPQVTTTATTVGAAGGASALPATPLGYLNTTLPNGTSVKIPYYTP